MRRLSALLIGVVAGFMWLSPAQAQGAGWIIIVATCGTPPSTLAPWSSTSPTLGVLTADTTGKLCTSGSGGGGGGAVTIANGADTVEGTITTAHGCSVAGYTVIGCLGQIDDDVKGPIPAGTNVIGKVDIDQTTPGTTNGVQLPSSQISADPCSLGNKTNVAISNNSTSSVQLVALSGSTTIYVCSLALISASANTLALTTGTGTACASSTAAVLGSATVANSLSLTANGGLTLGNGAGTVAKGASSSELCMLLGTAAYVSGNLTYVQQ